MIGRDETGLVIANVILSEIVNVNENANGSESHMEIGCDFDCGFENVSVSTVTEI